MKYKNLTHSQIIISIDRLSRFKPAEEKYLRVFKDIIVSNLIEPKYKKTVLDNTNYEKIRDIAVEIFNSSVGGDCKDLTINNYLKEYETKIFELNKNAIKLLENKLNFSKALEIISDTDIQNIKWLKQIAEKKDVLKSRQLESTLYPIEKVVIAEGITEEILLPKFADIYGYNFDKNGVKIIPAGGKNQVVKLYYKMCENLKLPMFILLDKDAQKNEALIHTRLRNHDRVYLLTQGEFEDLLPKQLVVKTINKEFKNFVKTTASELFSTNLPTVKILEEFFKEKCLHEFKKAEFAQRVKEQTKTLNDISDEVKKIIEQIKQL